MKKILHVVGARPQFIKASALHRAIASHNKSNPLVLIDELLVHTGQHYDDKMSALFFRELGIPKPNYHLGIGGCLPGEMTGRMVEGIEKVLIKEKPACVVVYGDTNSTLAGALAAVKLHIPVAHIEAGLRSFNRQMPEEINRCVVDQCSDFLFTPNQSAADQLKKEGFLDSKIFFVGDIMFDAALYFKDKSLSKEKILKRFSVLPNRYLLATFHRAENTDCQRKLKKILEGLIALSKKEDIIFPIHPRTRKAVEQLGLFKDLLSSKVKVIDPVGYLDMLALECYSKAILTDSGGVQKEAYFFEKPCVIVRKQTEWGELIKYANHRLLDIESESFVGCFDQKEKRKEKKNLFGHGDTAEKIIKCLMSAL